MVLAGINRNTGLVFDTNSFSSIDIRKWFSKYLSFGERCYDYTVSMLRRSGYFRQRNVVLDYVTKESNNLLKKTQEKELKEL